jgi:hypothetical protein
MADASFFITKLVAFYASQYLVIEDYRRGNCEPTHSTCSITAIDDGNWSHSINTRKTEEADTKYWA